MAQTTKAKVAYQLRWLLLLPIPFLWCLLEHYGVLTFLENRSVDWRFQIRGELESPVKLVYVDVDSKSIFDIGNPPWSRKYFSRVSAALVHEAGVRAVGIDYVLSKEGMAESADRQKLRADNIEFGRFLNKVPPVVLAAAYGGWRFRDEV